MQPLSVRLVVRSSFSLRPQSWAKFRSSWDYKKDRAVYLTALLHGVRFTAVPCYGDFALRSARSVLTFGVRHRHFPECTSLASHSLLLPTKKTGSGSDLHTYETQLAEEIYEFPTPTRNGALTFKSLNHMLHATVYCKFDRNLVRDISYKSYRWHT